MTFSLFRMLLKFLSIKFKFSNMKIHIKTTRMEIADSSSDLSLIEENFTTDHVLFCNVRNFFLQLSKLFQMNEGIRTFNSEI